MDLDGPDMLEDALGALDDMMGYFRMKGTDIIRIREILNVDASELAPETAQVMTSCGYVFVNGFYAKGSFIDRVMTQQEALSYVLRKQRVEKTDRYGTLQDLLAVRKYIRNEQELTFASSARRASNSRKRFTRSSWLSPVKEASAGSAASTSSSIFVV